MYYFSKVTIRTIKVFFLCEQHIYIYLTLKHELWIQSLAGSSKDRSHSGVSARLYMLSGGHLLVLLSRILTDAGAGYE